MIAAGANIGNLGLGAQTGHQGLDAAALQQWCMCGLSRPDAVGCADGSMAQGILGSSISFTNTLNNPSAQNALSARPGIAKRKCGRPKAPNPLEDPNIPEKKARRIMANRASADRSKQRAKLAAAEAKAQLAALNTQLASVCQQISDAEDCMSVLELVQSVVTGTPAPDTAVHSLRAQLQQGGNSVPGGPRPAQRSQKRKLAQFKQLQLQPMQHEQANQLPLLPLQDQQQPTSSGLAWHALLPHAIAPVVAAADPCSPAATAAAAAAAAAVVAQQHSAGSATLAVPAAQLCMPSSTSGPARSSAPAAQDIKAVSQQQDQQRNAVTSLQMLLAPLQQPQLKAAASHPPLPPPPQQQPPSVPTLLQASEGAPVVSTAPSTAGSSSVQQLLDQLLSKG